MKTNYSVFECNCFLLCCYTVFVLFCLIHVICLCCTLDIIKNEGMPSVILQDQIKVKWMKEWMNEWMNEWMDVFRIKMVKFINLVWPHLPPLTNCSTAKLCWVSNDESAKHILKSRKLFHSKQTQSRVHWLIKLID